MDELLVKSGEGQQIKEAKEVRNCKLTFGSSVHS